MIASESGVYLMSPKLFTNISKEYDLNSANFDLLVMDEAHSANNHRTSINKYLNHFRVKRMLLMTATPITN